MKLSRDGSNSGRFCENRAFMFFRNPEDFPFRPNRRVRASTSSGLSGCIFFSASISPSRIWSNILVCSSGASSSLASNALIKPAWDNLIFNPFRFNLCKTSRAKAISSTSASGEFMPMSSAPHCHLSLDFFPVSSNIKILVT